MGYFSFVCTKTCYEDLQPISSTKLLMNSLRICIDSDLSKISKIPQPIWFLFCKRECYLVTILLSLLEEIAISLPLAGNTLLNLKLRPFFDKMEKYKLYMSPKSDVTYDDRKWKFSLYGVIVITGWTEYRESESVVGFDVQSPRINPRTLSADYTYSHLKSIYNWDILKPSWYMIVASASRLLASSWLA